MYFKISTPKGYVAFADSNDGKSVIQINPLYCNRTVIEFETEKECHDKFLEASRNATMVLDSDLPTDVKKSQAISAFRSSLICGRIHE